jgi:uncharacterized circularly permuted ATP-grasp superfamily protein
MRGLQVPRNVYIAVVGSDLLRLNTGEFVVLEDNLRVPSGVSYMLTNRRVMKRTFPQLFHSYGVRPIEHYPQLLLPRCVRSLPRAAPSRISCCSRPASSTRPTSSTPISPGRWASIWSKAAISSPTTTSSTCAPPTASSASTSSTAASTTTSAIRSSSADSSLGCAGLFNAYRAGNVTVTNAFGTGLADDKAIYAYVPDIIKYYLNEDPILPNVKTYLLSDDKQRQHVLANLDKLVVKAVGESGGYGMLIGPQSTAASAKSSPARSRPIRATTSPSPRSIFPAPHASSAASLEPRHVDLRPYILFGDKVNIVPGGLTRVALEKGSLVVNSSQGGGSKDTWVLE